MGFFNTERKEKLKKEKITKEELLEKLSGVPLSDDELEKIAGGGVVFNECQQKCAANPIYKGASLKTCMDRCSS